MSDQDLYRGKCPECGDLGPHRVEHTMDDNAPTVTCQKCDAVWPKGSERPKRDEPPGAVDWA